MSCKCYEAFAALTRQAQRQRWQSKFGKMLNTICTRFRIQYVHTHFTIQRTSSSEATMLPFIAHTTAALCNILLWEKHTNITHTHTKSHCAGACGTSVIIHQSTESSSAPIPSRVEATYVCLIPLHATRAMLIICLMRFALTRTGDFIFSSIHRPDLLIQYTTVYAAMAREGVCVNKLVQFRL